MIRDSVILCRVRLERVIFPPEWYVPLTFFYTTRKRGKTLILLLTLFVISTFVLTGLSILAAADQSAA